MKAALPEVVILRRGEAHKSRGDQQRKKNSSHNFAHVHGCPFESEFVMNLSIVYQKMLVSFNPTSARLGESHCGRFCDSRRRISRTASASPDRQLPSLNPNVRSNLPLHRTEFSGRRAGVGYSLELMARIRCNLNFSLSPSAATMARANPHQETLPPAVM